MKGSTDRILTTHARRHIVRFHTGDRITMGLATARGRHGVTVNAIAPGTTATERVVSVRSQEQRDTIGTSTLVGRIAEVADMVGWVLFLAAPESSDLTGQTLSVNGGRLMV